MNMARGIKSRYRPVNEDKYSGNPDKIVCRSTWERVACRHLDDNSNVRKWSSEEVVVLYISAVDGEWHRYFVDFYVELNDGKKFLVEVKPKTETEPPSLPKSGRKTKGYLNALETYVRNASKWMAAKEYAEKRGMRFVIWTETELGLLRKKA